MEKGPKQQFIEIQSICGKYNTITPERVTRAEKYNTINPEHVPGKENISQ